MSKYVAHLCMRAVPSPPVNFRFANTSSDIFLDALLMPFVELHIRLLFLELPELREAARCSPFPQISRPEVPAPASKLRLPIRRPHLTGLKHHEPGSLVPSDCSRVSPCAPRPLSVWSIAWAAARYTKIEFARRYRFQRRFGP
jgi:hypothetical protein